MVALAGRRPARVLDYVRRSLGRSVVFAGSSPEDSRRRQCAEDRASRGLVRWRLDFGIRDDADRAGFRHRSQLVGMVEARSSFYWCGAYCSPVPVVARTVWFLSRSPRTRAGIMIPRGSEGLLVSANH